MKEIRRVLLVILAILPCVFYAAAARADADEDMFGDEAVEEKLTADFTFKITHETTSNVYSAGSNEESASRAVMGLTGDVKWPRGEKSGFKAKVAIAQHDYLEISGEDFKDMSLDLGYERDFGGGAVALVEVSLDETDVNREAVAEMGRRGFKTAAQVSKPVGARDTITVKAWRGNEKYERYSSLENRDYGYGAAVSRDLGGFVTLDAAYDGSRSHFPNEFIISTAGEETASYRSDKSETFTVSVSKIISLYPLSYAEAGFESENNSSDNTEFYLWYDPASGGFPTKVARGNDTYKKRSGYVYATKGLSDNDSISLYVMRDKTKYPNRLLGNYGNTEPVVPTVNTLDYLTLTFSHKLGEKQTVEAGGSWLRNRSNDDAYAYSERVVSLGVATEF